MWDFCVWRNPGTKGFLAGFHTFLQQCWIAPLPPAIVQTTLRSGGVSKHLRHFKQNEPSSPLTPHRHQPWQSISKCKQSGTLEDISSNYAGLHHSSLLLNCIYSWQWWMLFQIQGENRMDGDSPGNWTLQLFCFSPVSPAALSLSGWWKFSFTTVSIFFFWLSIYPPYCCSTASADGPNIAQKLFSSF